MKKCITIGDVHGRKNWKDFADIKFLLYAETGAAGYGGFVPEYDYYIFIGDYTDSFNITNEKIKENLLEIIRFKTLYPDNVILLWGNHDVNYFLNEPWKKMEGNVTGFSPDAHFDFYDIFNTNRDLFQLAFQIDNYLWTHAGVHTGWYNHTFKRAMGDIDIDDLTIADQLNEAFRYRIDCLFDYDWYRGGSPRKVGGPLWCSKQYSYTKPLENYHQIVGHTASDDINTYMKNETTSITYCDTLENNKVHYTTIL